jgi:hypothetical protein
MYSGSVSGHLNVTPQGGNAILTSPSSFLMAAFQNISPPELYNLLHVTFFQNVGNFYKLRGIRTQKTTNGTAFILSIQATHPTCHGLLNLTTKQ